MKSEKLFTIDKEFKTISAEISTLREWDILDLDYGTRGIVIDHADESETRWVVGSVHRDSEHDITHWELVPMRSTVAQFPEWEGYIMMVFND